MRFHFTARLKTLRIRSAACLTVLAPIFFFDQRPYAVAKLAVFRLLIAIALNTRRR